MRDSCCWWCWYSFTCIHFLLLHHASLLLSVVVAVAVVTIEPDSLAPATALYFSVVAAAVLPTDRNRMVRGRQQTGKHRTNKRYTHTGCHAASTRTERKNNWGYSNHSFAPLTFSPHFASPRARYMCRQGTRNNSSSEELIMSHKITFFCCSSKNIRRTAVADGTRFSFSPWWPSSNLYPIPLSNSRTIEATPPSLNTSRCKFCCYYSTLRYAHSTFVGALISACFDPRYPFLRSK